MKTMAITTSAIRAHLPIDFSLEFVPGPKLHVIEIPPRRFLFEKLPGEENSVVGLQIRMAIDLPPYLGAGPVADETRPAAACGD